MMNICKMVLECIDQYPEDEPIFIEEIKKYVIEKCKEDEKENVLKNINVILNRFKKIGIVKSEYKGVYYKPTRSIFGEVGLSQTRLIQLRYLNDREGNVKGYITGAKLFNMVGLTTLVPNIIEIVTNECKYHKIYNQKLRVYISKPRIVITNENYKYLQFIDILENKDNNHIQVKNVDKILYKIMKEYDLEYEKLIKYAKETNSKKALVKLITLAK